MYLFDGQPLMSVGKPVNFVSPSNLNVSLDEILRKQNSLFPSGPVIKCLLFCFSGTLKDVIRKLQYM